jgi:hypothetical protein
MIDNFSLALNQPDEPQTTMDLGQPLQAGFQFQATLAERYQPRTVDGFVGLSGVKRLFSGLVEKPKPCGILCIGEAGVGKSAMAMAFAEQLPGSLQQINGAKCTLKEIDAMRDRFAYYPPKGKFWICLVDEADQMTEMAQLQLLSHLDGTASLKPMWGGGFERGEPHPIIWIFTCNGRGPQQLDPPASLLPRFRSRCLIVPFAVPTPGELAIYLERVWAAERGPATPDGYFDFIASYRVGVRDALMRLEVDLLSGPRAVPAPAITPAPAVTIVPRRTGTYNMSHEGAQA